MSENKVVPVKKKGGLGRGLNALIEGSYDKKVDPQILHEVNTIAEIRLSQIETNPFQPRSHFDQTALEELAESIKAQAFILFSFNDPILIRVRFWGSYQGRIGPGSNRLGRNENAMV